MEKKAPKNYPPRIVKTMTTLCCITGFISLTGGILSLYIYLNTNEKRTFYLIAILVFFLIAIRQIVMLPKWLKLLKTTKTF